MTIIIQCDQDIRQIHVRRKESSYVARLDRMNCAGPTGGITTTPGQDVGGGRVFNRPD